MKLTNHPLNVYNFRRFVDAKKQAVTENMSFDELARQSTNDECARVERVCWGLPFTVGQTAQMQCAAVEVAAMFFIVPTSSTLEFLEWAKKNFVTVY